MRGVGAGQDGLQYQLTVHAIAHLSGGARQCFCQHPVYEIPTNLIALPATPILVQCRAYYLPYLQPQQQQYRRLLAAGATAVTEATAAPL